MKQLSEPLMIISDHGNAFAAKFVNGLGAASIGSGLTIGAVSSAMPQHSPDNWPAVVIGFSIFGSATFAIKNLYDFYVAWQNRKEQKRNKEQQQ
jgi:ABC-type uncharacterized transport system permease subunit